MRFECEGPLLRVSFRGQTVEAQTYLSADSGLSKIFFLHVGLREYPLLLPVVWIDSEFVDVLHGEPVTIDEVPNERSSQGFVSCALPDITKQVIENEIPVKDNTEP
jgi:hypothetical protein